ncbi:MAG: amidophosphoribosyltransferase [Kiritimatiellae bacterium]|nr:amidophosphoribosyltransferase [Kiritimatiellia bacterium]
MGGFFGVISRDDCVNDLFFGTDYHSHLGTRRGGMAVLGQDGFARSIHDITNAQFRSKFEQEQTAFKGRAGIGVISDYEDQPLLVTSHLGTYAITSVSCVRNLDDLAKTLFAARRGHFAETDGRGINPTEMIAALIDTQDSFADGIVHVQEQVEGSCSLLILTEKGELFAGRDRYGRTPVVLARKPGSMAVAMESCSLPNLGYRLHRELGPGEVVCLTPDGEEQRVLPRAQNHICAFMWVYFGFPASCFEGVNVENARYRCGAALARHGRVDADVVAGVPDSGVGHALGFACEARVPYARPFVKYTPTWPRSFMPPNQEMRDLIANKKLIPIPELIQGRRLVFCDDSIVRGTQLREQARRLYDDGAREIHMRIACPPLLFGCRFLNFSRSSSEDELIARRTARELEGDKADFAAYRDPDSERYQTMVERIRRRLGLTSLQYQRLDDLIEAIGLPREQICTYCWSGEDVTCPCKCAQ